MKERFTGAVLVSKETVLAYRDMRQRSTGAVLTYDAANQELAEYVRIARVTGEPEYWRGRRSGGLDVTMHIVEGVELAGRPARWVHSLIDVRLR